MYGRMTKAGIGCIWLACLQAASIAWAQEVSQSLLPAESLSAYLSELQTGSVAEGHIKLTAETLPTDSLFYSASREQAIDQPLLKQARLVILLRPDLAPQELDAALVEHGLTFVSALPEIGAINVNAGLRLESLADEAAVIGSFSDLDGQPLMELVDELRNDARFVAVTVDTYVSPQVLRSSVVPEADFSPGAATERTDWGMADAGFDAYWPRLSRPVPIGVIDVGFRDHEDLAFTNALPAHALGVHDHGNHVLGIMCGKHNGLGIRGALPNCEARVSSGAYVLDEIAPIQDPAVIGFYAEFSELLATVLEFVVDNPDVKVINLSLGYNWMPNFGIDPRRPEHAMIQDLIKAQGRIFMSVLAMAKRYDVAIVAAAGNDSSSLDVPLPAELASAFNFGSKALEALDGWSNGLVVEAHNNFGQRANFSNVGGHLSCPGVDVYSTVAHSRKAYGLMSGTSMAAPYCAAGLMALRMLRSDLNLEQAIACLRASPDKVENRVPKLNLRHAVELCR